MHKVELFKKIKNTYSQFVKACDFSCIEIVNMIEDKLNGANIFGYCRDTKELFKQAIERISKISKTDYNQIILYVATGTYSYGLIVVADIISHWKQRYRITYTN